jgi:predicted CXXCH cytochrome family protein
MKFWLGCVAVLALCVGAQAQFIGDVLGGHDLSPSGQSPIKGGLLPACQYCHAPHSGVGKGPLWAQAFSTQTYTLYNSTTTTNQTMAQPPVAGPSSLCLSCHDGTIGPATGTLSATPYGQIKLQGKMNQGDILGTNLQTSHPFSFNKLQDSPDLVSTLVTGHLTADPTKHVRLIRGNVECQSCHNPHVQNTDPVSLNFLVLNSTGGSLCLACHGTTPRTVNNLPNPLVPWPTNIHATAVNATLTAAYVGPYATVAQNSCSSCHVEHNANSPARLLRGSTPVLANMDSATENCINCHNGNNNIVPALPNVYAEFSKTTPNATMAAHPYPAGVNTHDAAEATLLNNNRHSTCVDCHNPHGSQAVGANFPNPPQIRVSQAAANGILASDGVTVLTPAQNQFDNCLRCHGTSTGKPTTSAFGYLPTWAVSYAADPFNVIQQFAATSSSSHPVLQVSNSPYPQPSLLSKMLMEDGVTQGRMMGTQIFCTDCHNSDDNREFGGAGPNGPHGSVYPHILERRYEMSQVSPGIFPAGGPGSPITNLFPGQLVSAGGAAPGPWALCGKCHNLTNVLGNTSSFQYHSDHVGTDGFSCSVCHTAHGMGGTSANITGERMVNFDTKVVAPNALDSTGLTLGISYSRAKNTCILVCHMESHNYDGSVTAVVATGTQSSTAKPGKR